VVVIGIGVVVVAVGVEDKNVAVEIPINEAVFAVVYIILIVFLVSLIIDNFLFFCVMLRFSGCSFFVGNLLTFTGCP
jgi:hypothetical protein